MASKLYGVNATIIIFVFVLYCIVYIYIKFYKLSTLVGMTKVHVRKAIARFEGGHGVDARSVRRREEAHEHRHGADHLAQGFVPRRTHHRTRLQHRIRRHETSQNVGCAASLL